MLSISTDKLHPSLQKAHTAVIHSQWKSRHSLKFNLYLPTLPVFSHMIPQNSF